MAFLNETHRRKDAIRPNPRKHGYVPVLETFKLLPRINCGKCGHPTCMAFAAALSMRKIDPARCPELAHPIRQNAVYPVYDSHGNLEKTVEIDFRFKERTKKKLPG